MHTILFTTLLHYALKSPANLASSTNNSDYLFNDFACSIYFLYTWKVYKALLYDALEFFILCHHNNLCTRELVDHENS